MSFSENRRGKAQKIGQNRVSADLACRGAAPQTPVRSWSGYAAFTLGFMAAGCFCVSVPRMILTACRMILNYHVERMCSWAHAGHGVVGSLLMVGLMLLCMTFLYQGFVRFKTAPLKSAAFYAAAFVIALSEDSFIMCS